MILTCPSCSASFKADPALLGASGRSVRCGSCGHSWHQMPPDEDPEPALEVEEVVEERHEPEPAETAEQQDDLGIEEVAEEASALEIEEVVEDIIEEVVEDIIEEVDEPAFENAVEQEDEIEIAAEPEERVVVEEAPRHQVKAVERRDPVRAERSKRARTRSSAMAAERRTPSRVIGWIALLLLLAVLAGTLWVGKSRIMALAPGTARFYEMVGLYSPVAQGLELREVISERRVVDGERQLVVEGTIVNVTETPLQVPQIRASLTDGVGTELTQWTFTADSETLPPGGFTTFQTSTSNPPDEGNLSLAFIEGGQD